MLFDYTNLCLIKKLPFRSGFVTSYCITIILVKWPQRQPTCKSLKSMHLDRNTDSLDRKLTSEWMAYNQYTKLSIKESIVLELLLVHAWSHLCFFWLILS